MSDGGKGTILCNIVNQRRNGGRNSSVSMSNFVAVVVAKIDRSWSYIVIEIMCGSVFLQCSDHA